MSTMTIFLVVFMIAVAVVSLFVVFRVDYSGSPSEERDDFPMTEDLNTDFFPEFSETEDKVPENPEHEAQSHSA